MTATIIIFAVKPISAPIPTVHCLKTVSCSHITCASIVCVYGAQTACVIPVLSQQVYGTCSMFSLSFTHTHTRTHTVSLNKCTCQNISNGRGRVLTAPDILIPVGSLQIKGSRGKEKG